MKEKKGETTIMKVQMCFRAEVNPQRMGPFPHVIGNSQELILYEYMACDGRGVR